VEDSHKHFIFFNVLFIFIRFQLGKC